MRLIGYCRGCRKVRYVRVAGHDLAFIANKSMAQGLCADCEKEGKR